MIFFCTALDMLSWHQLTATATTTKKNNKYYRTLYIWWFIYDFCFVLFCFYVTVLRWLLDCSARHYKHRTNRSVHACYYYYYIFVGFHNQFRSFDFSPFRIWRFAVYRIVFRAMPCHAILQYFAILYVVFAQFVHIISTCGLLLLCCWLILCLWPLWPMAMRWSTECNERQHSMENHVAHHSTEN